MGACDFLGACTLLRRALTPCLTPQPTPPHPRARASCSSSDPTGRAPSSVVGCPSRGRLVRFSITSSSGALGTETVVLPVGGVNTPPGAASGAWCAQFDKGSVDYVGAPPGGSGVEDLFVSSGAGANIDYSTVADIGGCRCWLRCTAPHSCVRPV